MHDYRLLVVGAAAALASLGICDRAAAQATYGNANQALTIVVQFGGDVGITESSANTDSEAEVHGMTDDGQSETFPTPRRSASRG